MTRIGNTFTAERSADGTTWVQVGTHADHHDGRDHLRRPRRDVPQPAPLNTSTFDNVSFDTTAPTADFTTPNEGTTTPQAATSYTSPGPRGTTGIGVETRSLQRWKGSPSGGLLCRDRVEHRRRSGLDTLRRSTRPGCHGYLLPMGPDADGLRGQHGGTPPGPCWSTRPRRRSRTSPAPAPTSTRPPPTRHLLQGRHHRHDRALLELDRSRSRASTSTTTGRSRRRPAGPTPPAMWPATPRPRTPPGRHLGHHQRDAHALQRRADRRRDADRHADRRLDGPGDHGLHAGANAYPDRGPRVTPTWTETETAPVSRSRSLQRADRRTRRRAAVARRPRWANDGAAATSPRAWPRPGCIAATAGR